jgi:pathogenesis-related protein 1
MESPLQIMRCWVLASLCCAIAQPSIASPQQVAKQPTSSQTCTGNQLTAAEIQEILAIHNQARSEVEVPPLTWNCKLADYAQKWVNQDKWGHSPVTNLRQIIPGSQAGENIAAAAPATQPIITSGPTDWVQEKRNWDNKSGMCKSGKSCTHYTQVVWRTTTQVGCGINRQSSAMGGQWKGNSVYLTCVYNPGGNLVQSNGRMKPY